MSAAGIALIVPLLSIALPCASVAAIARSLHLLAELAAGRRQELVGMAYAQLAVACTLASESLALVRDWGLAAVVFAVACGCTGIWYSERYQGERA